MIVLDERAKPKHYEASPMWWIVKPKYLAIFLRELSAFFILSYAILNVLSLIQLKSGEQSYSGFLQLVSSAPFSLFSVILLVFAVYHTVTWFVLSSRVFPPLRVGNRTVSRKAWTGSLIIVWIVSSYLVVVLVFGGG